MDSVLHNIQSSGVLDYVSAWYIKTVRYLKGEEQQQRQFNDLFDELAPAQHVKVAFVSTNSITQGEQVSVLWSELLKQGVKIHFAHLRAISVVQSYCYECPKPAEFGAAVPN